MMSDLNVRTFTVTGPCKADTESADRLFWWIMQLNKAFYSVVLREAVEIKVRTLDSKTDWELWVSSKGKFVRLVVEEGGYEWIREGGCVAPHIITACNRWREWRVSCPLSFCLWGKSYTYPLVSTLVGFRGWSGCCGEKKSIGSCRPFAKSLHSVVFSEYVNLTLCAPCITLQYVYEPTRCTKFLWLHFIFY